MNNTLLVVLTVLTPVLMAIIVAIQSISVALIQRGRKEDKQWSGTSVLRMALGCGSVATDDRQGAP